MRFYMTVGRPEINRRLNEAGVVVNNQTKNLTEKEFVIWSSLAWNIHTFKEIKAIYNEYLNNGEQSDDELVQLIDRLEQRGLIVIGRGAEMWTALYDLFGKVTMVPCNSGILTDIFAFFHILFSDKSLENALKVFKKERLTFDEKVILKLAGRAKVSPSYIVDQIIYHEGKVSKKTDEEFERFYEQRLSVLKSAATLYLKKYILFEQGSCYNA